MKCKWRFLSTWQYGDIHLTEHSFVVFCWTSNNKKKTTFGRSGEGTVRFIYNLQSSCTRRKFNFNKQDGCSKGKETVYYLNYIFFFFHLMTFIKQVSQYINIKPFNVSILHFCSQSLPRINCLTRMWKVLRVNNFLYQ